MSSEPRLSVLLSQIIDSAQGIQVNIEVSNAQYLTWIMHNLHSRQRTNLSSRHFTSIMKPKKHLSRSKNQNLDNSFFPKCLILLRSSLSYLLNLEMKFKSFAKGIIGSEFKLWTILSNDLEIFMASMSILFLSLFPTDRVFCRCVLESLVPSNWTI